MRRRVQSLASLICLRIRCCHELWCRSQTRLGSTLLWLWYRLAATALIGSLAWELMNVEGVALKRWKKKKKKDKWNRYLCKGVGMGAPEESNVEDAHLPAVKSQERSQWKVKFKLEPWKSLTGWIQWCSSLQELIIKFSGILWAGY